MKMTAVVSTQGGSTLVIQLPGNVYDLYEKLHSIGVMTSPNRIRLTDEDADAVRVKLFGEDEVGKHLTLLLTEHDTLADAHTVAFVVDAANPDIRESLEQKILQDVYSSPDALYDDVKQMLRDMGPVKETFFFPLSGVLYERDGEYGDEEQHGVTNRYLQYYEDEIHELMLELQSPGMGDMAEYMGNHPGVREKLVSAVWDVECINHALYGKVTAHLRAPFTDEEEAAFKDEINGQAADGYGEGFEQQPIETGDGDLYVSLWHSGDDYFIYDETEMENYLASLDQQMF